MAQKIIYTTSEGKVTVVHPTGEVPITDLVLTVVPEGTNYSIVEEKVIPTDTRFRNAWSIVGFGDDATVQEDLTKLVTIAHDMRRAAREEEFSPYDDIIAKQIPGADLVAAEAAREEIRTRYSTIQTNIDSASTVSEVKTELQAQGIIQ